MDIRKIVGRIIGDVRLKGDDAVCRLTKKFDGVKLHPGQMRVNRALINSAASKLNPELRRAIETAALNARAYAASRAALLKKNSQPTFRAGGAEVSEMLVPVGTAALYVPGGRYSYPSSVIMTAAPAVAAGVGRIYILTPPRNATAAVLYAAKVSGVDEIYLAGGAQAIAAAAYGTKTIPMADVIAGPGNRFVTEAKRQVFGDVGIDMLAGPSEVAIIADETASPSWIAADLAAQAEHDSSAVSYLFASTRRLAERVRALVAEEYRARVKITVALPAKACGLVNIIAPEHLELMVKNPRALVGKIRSAGAVFVGNMTPTALGDYCAGPSHVLPTGGSARFSSGLSPATFLKRISVLAAPRTPILSGGRLLRAAAILAGAEGLEWHAKSALLRMKK
ncbi:MAG: histidinol dehydrogenase [Endomicrobiia bacterium]|nr:histidinol dehydrogenase [Endomicrobiia bacterium]